MNLGADSSRLRFGLAWISRFIQARSASKGMRTACGTRAAPVLDFPFTNDTGLGILRCPAQGEITIAAKVSSQARLRRRHIE